MLFREQIMLDVIGSLPDRQRTVFLLHRYEGYSYTRIAAHLGISTKAVKRAMCKALRKIHKAAEKFNAASQL